MYKRLNKSFNDRKRLANQPSDFESSLPKRINIQHSNNEQISESLSDGENVLGSSYGFQENEFEYDFNNENLDALYSNSRYSKFDFCMALLFVARKSKITDAALDNILHLFNLILPFGNKCPKTVKAFKKYLNGEVPVEGEPEKVKFCKKCFMLVTSCKCRNRQNEEENTENALIQKFNIVNQVSTVIERYSEVRKNYSDFIASKEDTVYVDALSGSARKIYSNDIISIALYTDGIKISKSSSDELWILGATILDLPMKIRFAQKNFIFLVAWYSSSKPVWSLFSDYVNQQLGRLIWVSNLRIPMAVLQVNADIPARASFLNCMQSGYCPCLRCNVRGEYLPDVRQMQYQSFENTIATAESYMQDVEKVLNNKTNNTVACPKGYCSFDQLQIPECVTSDIMHTVYYGPLRDDLMELFKSCSSIKSLFDTVILSIKWPTELSKRKLRLLSEINLFKANELKTLILYLTAPLLNVALNTLPALNFEIQKQMKNILLGISAILPLMQDEVCERDILQSKEQLKKWFDDRRVLFSHNSYTQKVHEFTHLPDQVRIHGPLQGSSCFAGENVLNRITKMITCRIGPVLLKQVAERSEQEIEIEKWKFIQEDEPLKEFIRIVEQKTKTSSESLLPPETPLANYIPHGTGLSFTKIEGYEYSASAVKDNEKNSYCCFIHQRRYKVGLIEYISTESEKIYLQIQPFECEQLNDVYAASPMIQNYFILGQKIGQPLVLEQSVVKTKGFVFNSTEKIFFVPLAHVFEHN